MFYDESEKKSIERESEEEKEEAAGQEVSERKEDEMVVEASKSGAEDVQGEKNYPKRKAKYCRNGLI